MAIKRLHPWVKVPIFGNEEFDARVRGHRRFSLADDIRLAALDLPKMPFVPANYPKHPRIDAPPPFPIAVTPFDRAYHQQAYTQALFREIDQRQDIREARWEEQEQRFLEHFLQMRQHWTGMYFARQMNNMIDASLRHRELMVQAHDDLKVFTRLRLEAYDRRKIPVDPFAFATRHPTAIVSSLEIATGAVPPAVYLAVQPEAIYEPHKRHQIAQLHRQLRQQDFEHAVENTKRRNAAYDADKVAVDPEVFAQSFRNSIIGPLEIAHGFIPEGTYLAAQPPAIYEATKRYQISAQHRELQTETRAEREATQRRWHVHLDDRKTAVDPEVFAESAPNAVIGSLEVAHGYVNEATYLASQPGEIYLTAPELKNLPRRTRYGDLMAEYHWMPSAPADPLSWKDPNRRAAAVDHEADLAARDVLVAQQQSDERLHLAAHELAAREARAVYWVESKRAMRRSVSEERGQLALSASAYASASDETHETAAWPGNAAADDRAATTNSAGGRQGGDSPTGADGGTRTSADGGYHTSEDGGNRTSEDGGNRTSADGGYRVADGGYRTVADGGYRTSADGGRYPTAAGSDSLSNETGEGRLGAAEPGFVQTSGPVPPLAHGGASMSDAAEVRRDTRQQARELELAGHEAAVRLAQRRYRADRLRDADSEHDSVGAVARAKNDDA